MHKDIVKLLDCLPQGKKHSYFDRTYITGLTNFFDAHDEVNDINLDYILAYSFKELLDKEVFLNDIKLFYNQHILNIMNCDENEILKLSSEQIQERIKSAFNIIEPHDQEAETKLSKNINTSTNCEYKLHPFQERMRKRVVNLIFNNQKRFLIHMPTGSGKTRTATEIILDFIRLSAAKALLNENYKILWIAQSNELCEQAYETFKYIYDKKGTEDIQIQHFYGNNNLTDDIDDHPAIIFCGIQKLLKNYSKNSVWQRIRNNNYLVIVDEAHRSVASQWKKALDFFVDNSSTYLLGLTATPGSGSIDDQTSGYTLANYFDNNKLTITDEFYKDIEKPIHYLISQGFLAKIKRKEIESEYINSNLSIKSVSQGSFDFSKETLKELSINPRRNKFILDIITDNLKKDKKNKILVFSCGIEHNKILHSLLSFYGIKSDYIDATTKNRDLIINEFKHGDLNVLLNFGVLTTGFDAPKTNICIIARPISSIVMYSQMVGRILRGPKNGGNTENILYTIKDNFNHGDYDAMFNSFNDFYN